MDPQWTVSLGEGAEILADRYGISREDQDAFAVKSHRRAARAWQDGAFVDHLVHLPGVALTRDEGIRDATTESLAKLRAVFRKDGTVTAGNASQISDGSAALLLASAERAEELGIEPLARITANAAHGVDPDIYGEGPVVAVARAGQGRQVAF